MNQWVGNEVKHGGESLHRNSGFTYNSACMRLRILAIGLALVAAAPSFLHMAAA